MVRITAAEFQKRYGRYSRMAIDGEPVIVTSHGRDRNAVISAGLFRELAAAAGRGDLIAGLGDVPPARSRNRVRAAAALPYSGVVRPVPAAGKGLSLGQILSSGAVADEDPPAF